MSKVDPAAPAAMPLPQDVALVLQGGGALGSYQGGVAEALLAANIEIDWVAGISIGAINAALIAGNEPEHRGRRLRAFWERVSSGLPDIPLWGGDIWREWVHLASANYVAGVGAPGFFRPRGANPFIAAPGSPDALSLYDTAPLAETLDQLVDWDRLNTGPMRVSVGAVDVETGNLHTFDNRETRIDARHIMASGALPPGLPPVEIDGRLWWDGGIVSNTPLDFVLSNQTADMLIFQVDLFPARGEVPKTIIDVMSREKDIRYSSRTRAITDTLIRRRREREVVRDALTALPAELCGRPEIVELGKLAHDPAASVVHLIYRARSWEGGAKDYEFSRGTMEEHWAAGREAVAVAVESGDLIASNLADGVTTAFDLTP